MRGRDWAWKSTMVGAGSVGPRGHEMRSERPRGSTQSTSFPGPQAHARSALLFHHAASEHGHTLSPLDYTCYIAFELRNGGGSLIVWVCVFCHFFEDASSCVRSHTKMKWPRMHPKETRKTRRIKPSDPKTIRRTDDGGALC